MKYCITASDRERKAASAGAKTARQIVLESLLSGSSADPTLSMTEDAGEADLVLFIEPAGDESDTNDALQQIVRSEVYLRHKRKVVVYSAKDLPRPLVPGLYPSIPRPWAGILGCQGAPYLTPQNPYLTQDVGWKGQAEHLAGFCGVCRGIPLRLRLLELRENGPSGRIMVSDTSDAFLGSLRRKDLAAHNGLKAQFVRRVLESKYALCPRGNGPSSFRIFEAMQLARAPVIIADEWTPPRGPDWSSFMIQVRERDVPRMEEIIANKEHEWQKRGDLAREAWVRFYSPQRLGQTIVQQAADVLRGTQSWRSIRRIGARTYVLVPRRIAYMRRKLGRMVASRNAVVREEC